MSTIYSNYQTNQINYKGIKKPVDSFFKLSTDFYVYLILGIFNVNLEPSPKTEVTLISPS